MARSLGLSVGGRVAPGRWSVTAQAGEATATAATPPRPMASARRRLSGEPEDGLSVAEDSEPDVH